MQGVHDNYDTDTFKALIGASESLTGVKAEGDQTASHRVIADHLRSTSFLMADGVLPSNEGRGYVLRRIMRRAMRHAHLLGANEPLMHRLVPALVAEMGQAYPELVRGQALIEEVLEREETQFRRTLEKGLRLLDEATAEMAEGGELDGETAFRLYDTYGFPYDLTEDALRSRGLGVDRAGFDAAIEQQKAAARAAWKGSGQAADSEVWFDIAEREGATEFTGYSSTSGEGTVVALVRDGEEVQSATSGEEIVILTNQTPFYGESGGQTGDVGTISTTEGLNAEVSDTSKPLGRLHAHHAKLKAGSIAVGDTVHLEVDVERRDRIRANHSATHLVHAALRNTLGDPLFVRTQEGMTPTPVARGMIGRVRRALQLVEGCIEPPAEFDPASSEQTIMCSFSDLAEVLLLPAMVSRLADIAPAMSVRSYHVPRSELPTELAAGTVDIAADVTFVNDRNLNHAPLIEDEFVCAVRPDHPAVRRKPTLKQYLQLGHVHISSRRRGAGEVDQVMKTLGHRRRIVTRVRGYATAPHILAATDLACTMPRSVAEQAGLRCFSLPFDVPRVNIHMFWHKSADADPANVWLRGLLEESLKLARGQRSR